MKDFKKKIMISGLFLMAFGAVSAFAQEAGMPAPEEDAVVEEVVIEEESAAASINWGMAFAILGAAVATFGGGFGSSVGVGVAGEVGDGVLAEDGKKFGTVLLLQALPMTQSIYGMLIAFVVLGKVTTALSMVDGLGILFACLPIAVTGLISGIWQGKVAAASMQLIARKPKQAGQAIILPAMVETFAVFGLLVSIIFLGKVG